MSQRPRSITILSGIFIGVGFVALVHHSLPPIAEIEAGHPGEFALIVVTELAAILSGVLMLRGSNVGRWLLVGWLAFHVILSLRHSLPELAIHTAMLVIVLYFLFHPRASAYFQGKTTRA